MMAELFNSRINGVTNSIYVGRLSPEKYLPLFVTSSSAETFGWSKVEVMAAGLPTLGIDSPGTGDFIEEGVIGLVTSDNLEVFTTKLKAANRHHNGAHYKSTRILDRFQ